MQEIEAYVRVRIVVPEPATDDEKNAAIMLLEDGIKQEVPGVTSAVLTYFHDVKNAA